MHPAATPPRRPAVLAPFHARTLPAVCVPVRVCICEHARARGARGAQACVHLTAAVLGQSPGATSPYCGPTRTRRRQSSRPDRTQQSTRPSLTGGVRQWRSHMHMRMRAQSSAPAGRCVGRAEKATGNYPRLKRLAARGLSGSTERQPGRPVSTPPALSLTHGTPHAIVRDTAPVRWAGVLGVLGVLGT